ncbi:hypothetical protein [Herbaspirillum rubrisubalbicans]|uniref:hypothetical protein n=1 Tax=Herbaspirillum rubrisubalbicans TaxID=80842 RepID=UPI0015C56150|nr:hypothetical protein [Herbaspirillum rubrisubalbicans]NQE51899.1 hypothetical protein [Herbaspirillum rubrisubalbicans]
MQSKEDAHEILSDLWKGRPEEEAGRLIIEYLAQHIEAKHISLADLIQVASKQERRAVLNIINYLSGEDLNLLDSKFEYVAEDESSIFELDLAQVKAARSQFINPLSGESDEDVLDKIFMFFVPSDLAREALKT